LTKGGQMALQSKAFGNPFGIVFGIFDPVGGLDHPIGIIFGIFDPVWASDHPCGIIYGIFDPVWAAAQGVPDTLNETLPS